MSLRMCTRLNLYPSTLIFFNIVFSKNISCSFFAGKAVSKKVQTKTCNLVETQRKSRAVEEIVAREKIIEL